MNSFVNRIIALSVFCVCGIAFGQEEPAQAPSHPAKPKAAVYIMGAPDGRDALRMAVNNFLIKSGMYRMIAVDALDVVAAEHNRQFSGAVSDADIASLGWDAGAQYVCVVERTWLDRISYVAVRMVSVRSKVAELADMAELPYGERVIDVIEKLINSMLGVAPIAEAENNGSSSASAKKNSPTVSTEDNGSSTADGDDESASYSGAVYVAKPRSKMAVRSRPERGQSFGIGGLFVSDAGGGLVWSGSGERVVMPYYGGGLYAYWDGVYAELSGGLTWGGGRWESANASDPGDLPEMSRVCWRFGIFGKFPLIDAGANVRLFPLYGIDYDMPASDTNSTVALKFSDGSRYVFDGEDGRPSGKDLRALWFKFGGGVDIYGERLYLRLEALYGIRPASKFESDCVENEKRGGRDAKANPGRGLTVRLAVGINPK